jgi:hypothetical protein
MKKATLLIGARITVKIPAHSIAPRLLLEWIGEYNFKNNNRPLLFTILKYLNENLAL